MTLADALETTRIHHVAGHTDDCTALAVVNLGWAPPMTPVPLRA
jgi:hypothetical protein